MNKKQNECLKKIEKIEGLLVPGQEKILFLLSSVLKRGSNIVEIGSFKGKSTACLSLGRKYKDIKIYSIDTFEGNKKDFIRGRQFKKRNFFNEYKNNLIRLGLFNNVIPIKGYSQEVGKKWNKPIDLLFIDGSHLYEDVKKDFELFYPWVNPGGFVLFHDVHPEFVGVYKVWHKIAKRKLTGQANVHTLYFGRKPVSFFSRFTDPLETRLIIKEAE